jgi:hypothetical protein
VSKPKSRAREFVNGIKTRLDMADQARHDAHLADSPHVARHLKIGAQVDFDRKLWGQGPEPSRSIGESFYDVAMLIPPPAVPGSFFTAFISGRAFWLVWHERAWIPYVM